MTAAILPRQAKALDELALMRAAIAKASTACRAAADGDLEARITHIDEFGELRPFLSSINQLLDMTDAFVRGFGAHDASVTADTYPGKVYAGRVTFIASEAEFTPRSVQTEKERVKLVYRVKIALSNPNFELKPGMPAEGVIAAAP